jgi:monoamine oxidase
LRRFESTNLSGGDHVPDAGYETVVEVMAQGLTIELEQVVEQVRVHDEGVEVTTSAGETWSGSHAVVTVSVGVLKSGAITFEPSLPDDKLEAIDRLDMGNVERVAVRFDEPWWNEGDLYFVSEAQDGRFPVVVDMTATAGVPTLVAFYGGSFARAIQGTQTDDAIVADLMSVLTQVHGSPPPAPLAYEVTHWTTDPYSRGSYTYVPIGASDRDFEVLAQPVGSRLLFAGESTDHRHHATVHGAMMTGLREAKRLGVTIIDIPGLQEW